MLLAQSPPLSLDDALKLAMERNADLRKQVLLSLSAEQDQVLARAAVLPRLDFNASVGRVRQAGELFLSGVPGDNQTSFYKPILGGMPLRQQTYVVVE